MIVMNNGATVLACDLVANAAGDVWHGTVLATFRGPEPFVTWNVWRDVRTGAGFEATSGHYFGPGDFGDAASDYNARRGGDLAVGKWVARPDSVPRGIRT